MTDSSPPVDDTSAVIYKIGLFVEDLPGNIGNHLISDIVTAQSARPVHAIFGGIIFRWLEGEQNGHRRAALLEAYRRRRHWRKADIAKLRALGVSPAADRRLQRIESAKSPGRGVIRSYSPLGETLMAGITHLRAYYDPATPPGKRLAVLKKTRPWWPYIVEALYRGEYHARKSSQTKSPSEIAEHEVARRLRVSPSVVHKLCTAVRQERGDARPDCQPIPMAHFDVWLQKGGSIWPKDGLASDDRQ